MSNSISFYDVGVETSADSGTTLSEFGDFRELSFDSLDGIANLGHIAREFLSKSKRSSILGVGSSDLDDVLEFFRLLFKSSKESLETREESLMSFQHCGNVHHRGEGIVRGLRHVHVIVRVNGIGEWLSQDFHSTVGNDFIGVHVALSAGTSLPNDQGELIVELA